MIRFLFRHYQRLLIAVTAIMSVIHVGSIVVNDLGPPGLGSSTLDNIMVVYGIVLFTLAPFLVACHAMTRLRQAMPDTRALRGWNLGLSLNAILGAVSVAFGILQAALRHYSLGEPESLTGNYLLVLLFGFVFVLWLGGVMGWIGHRAAVLLYRNPA
jgi:hypothetical protein